MDTELPFWKTKKLDEMTREEWESLCDGCGWCCLHKLEDIDTGEVFYTYVVCQYFDLHRCRCTEYAQRSVLVPTCLQLTTELIPRLTWLPESCAYRRVAEGKDLPEWHPLVCKNDYTMHKLGHSIRRKAISERNANMEQLEVYVFDGPER